jgi:hypothetical protein
MATVYPGAVDIYDADNIVINRNTFTHCGATAVNAVNGVTQLQIVGNTFEDISATAVSIGHPQHVVLGDEGRLYPEEQNPQQVVVSNNLLREVSCEFGHCPGITAFFVEGLDLMHNDIGPMEYSQISAGWGWRAFPDVKTSWDNRINYNKMVAPCQGLGDGGSIYTLGAMGGNSEVRGNYMSIPAPYKASGQKWALYADQGWSSKLWTNNVIEDFEIWLNKLRDTPALVDSNYTTTSQQECRETCPTNTFLFSKADRPQAVKDIIANAGIEPAYQQAWDGTIPEIDPGVGGVAVGPGFKMKSVAIAPSVQLLRNRIQILPGVAENLPLTCSLFDMQGRQIVQMVMTDQKVRSMALPMTRGSYVLSMTGSKVTIQRQFITVR